MVTCDISTKGDSVFGDVGDCEAAPPSDAAAPTAVQVGGVGLNSHEHILPLPPPRNTTPAYDPAQSSGADVQRLKHGTNRGRRGMVLRQLGYAPRSGG